MATTPAPTESTTVDLLSGLTGPLPTHGDPYLTALAAVQELEERISMASHLLDVVPEEIEPIIADLKVRLNDRKAALTRATHHREAAMARSSRMRGSTTSLRERKMSPRRARAPRRGHVDGRRRPGAKRTSSRASSRGDPDLPPKHRPPLHEGTAA